MFNAKVIFLVSCLIVASATAQNAFGGARDVSSGNRAHALNLLNQVINLVNSGDGSSYTYDVHRITQKVVNGILYGFELTLSNQDNVNKECTITIWSKPSSTAGKEVTFNCEGEEVVKETLPLQD